MDGPLDDGAPHLLSTWTQDPLGQPGAEVVDMHTMLWLLTALLGGGARADEAELASSPACGGACAPEQQCVSDRCVFLFEEDAFLEARFNIVQPRELGAAADSILDTIALLGIDLRFAAMTFAPAGEETWEVEYGAALGDAQGKYTYQKATRHRLSLRPTGDTGLSWQSDAFVYTFEAAIRFLGVRINVGPVMAHETVLTTRFSEDGTVAFSEGHGLLPASQAQALDFMTRVVVTSVNALSVAGLGCADVCDPAVCQQTDNYLPRNGLEVIQCNPTVVPAGRRDFGYGVEDYYPMTIRLDSARLPAGIQEP